MWHEGTGIIQYDPPRGNMKRNVKWWCVINIDREITRYYRWWIERRYHVKGLHRPSWDAHISVIRGERPPDELMHLWNKYNGRRVEFRYQHSPYQGDALGRKNKDAGFWTIEVDCPFGIQIRKEFGFKHDWPLHITVGRTYY